LKLVWNAFLVTYSNWFIFVYINFIMKKILLIVFTSVLFYSINAQVCLKPTIYTPGGWSLASGDFNNDGKLDLINGSDSLCTMAGDGIGGFSRINAMYVSSIGNMVSADFNKDGNLDLASSQNAFNAGNVIVLLGTGTGSFGAPSFFPVGTNPWGITSNDFNNDGNPDIAVTNSGQNDASVLLGDGTGNFSAHVDYYFGDHTSYGSVNGITSKDFNGDGNIDLAVSVIDSIAIMLGNGTGTFGTITLYPGGPSSNGSNLSCDDFNGDGFADIAAADGTSGTVSVWLGTGTGTFGSATTTTFPVSVQCGPIANADYNSDGKLDLIVANSYSNKISLLLGNGTGGFNIATSFPDTYVAENLISADFNSDGKPDLAVGNQQGSNFMIFLNVAAPNLNLSSSSLTNICYGASATLTVSGATTYTWSSNTGLSSSNNTITTVAVTPSVNTTYSVIAEENGCADSASVSFSPVFPQIPSICMVTTDSSSNYNYNIIYWENTNYTNVDSFIFYRNHAGTYLRLGAVSKDSSRFVDTYTNIGGPNGGNPNLTSYQYAMRLRDTCGNLSGQSIIHQTTNVYVNGTNIDWNSYTINGVAVSGYDVYWDSSGTDHFVLYLSGLTSTQVNVPSFVTYPNQNFRVDPVLNYTCNVGHKESNPNNNPSSIQQSSHSNTTKPVHVNAIKNVSSEIKFSALPNPSDGKITITCISEKNQKMNLEVYNMLGKKIYSTIDLFPGQSQIDLSAYPAGVYFLNLKADGNLVVRKIVIQ
jgi:hypothetical protein